MELFRLLIAVCYRSIVLVPLLCCFLLGALPLATADDKPVQHADALPHAGYVDCSTKDKNGLTPVFLNPCNPFPIGNLSCGQKVEVTERQGSWLRITTPDGITRYVAFTAISQVSDAFRPFDSDSGVQDKGIPHCPAPATNATRAPRAIFAPNPDFSEKRGKNGVQGTVVLSCVVGIDGRAHDVKVVHSLGNAMDEEAIKALQRWKFEPASVNGKPVASEITIYIESRLIELR